MQRVLNILPLIRRDGEGLPPPAAVIQQGDMMIGPLLSPECVAELRSIRAHMRAAAENNAHVETKETAKALARLCSCFILAHERQERAEREREQA